MGILTIVASSMTLSVAHARVCGGFLGVEYPKMSRETEEFHPNELSLFDKTFRKLRDNTFIRPLPQNELQHWTTDEFIRVLAEKSNLKTERSLQRIRVSVKNGPGDDSLPHASLQGGIVFVNRAMWQFTKTPSERAVVAGRQLLHFTLGHELLFLRAEKNIWAKVMNNFSFGDGKTSYRALIKKLNEEFEDEVDLALPHLLHNAGYDAWAIVDLNHRFLDLVDSTHPNPIDAATRAELVARNQRMIERLKSLGFERIEPPQKSDHRSQVMPE